jgi:hypothetical protein
VLNLLSSQMMNTLDRRKRAAALVLAVAGLALTASGCGSDSSTSADSPTKAAFIKQGDKACRKTDHREAVGLKAYAEKHEGDFGTKNYELDLIAAVGVPALEQEAEELSELTPPEGDEEEVDAIVAAIEEANEETLQDPSLAAEGSEDSPYANSEKLARAYGFKVCGEF